MAVSLPLVIRPAGWTPATVAREWRDERGRHRVVAKRDDLTGRIAGNDRGPSVEYQPPTTMGTAGLQHATVRPPTVRVTLRASQFGLTVDQLSRVVAATFSPLHQQPARQGLVIPGGSSDHRRP